MIPITNFTKFKDEHFMKTVDFYNGYPFHAINFIKQIIIINYIL